MRGKLVFSQPGENPGVISMGVSAQVEDSMTHQRFSPFGSLVGDNCKSLRLLEGDAWTERWFGSYEGGCSTINAYFAEAEAYFIGLRESTQLARYDQTLLRIFRDQKARELLARAKETFWPYIKARSRLPMELQPLWEQSDEGLGVETVVA